MGFLDTAIDSLASGIKSLPKPVKAVGRVAKRALTNVVGGAETALQFGAVIPAQLAAKGVAGIVGASSFLLPSEGDKTNRAERTIANVEGATAPIFNFLRPRTELAQGAERAINVPFEALNTLAERKGELVRDRTGSDVRAAITVAGIKAAPLILPFGKKIGKALARGAQEAFPITGGKFGSQRGEVKFGPDNPSPPTRRLEAIANADVNAMLKENLLGPVVKGKSISVREGLDAAANRLKRNPNLGRDTAEFLNSKGGKPTGENALDLLVSETQIDAQLTLGSEAIRVARASNDPVKLAQAEAAQATLRETAVFVGNASALAATNSSQFMRMRQVFAAERFSRKNLQDAFSDANKGEKLSPETQTEIEAFDTKLKDTNAAVTKAEAVDVLAEREAARTVPEIVKRQVFPDPTEAKVYKFTKEGAELLGEPAKAGKGEAIVEINQKTGGITKDGRATTPEKLVKEFPRAAQNALTDTATNLGLGKKGTAATDALLDSKEVREATAKGKAGAKSIQERLQAGETIDSILNQALETNKFKLTGEKEPAVKSSPAVSTQEQAANIDSAITRLEGRAKPPTKPTVQQKLGLRAKETFRLTVENERAALKAETAKLGEKLSTEAQHRAMAEEIDLIKNGPRKVEPSPQRQLNLRKKLSDSELLTAMEQSAEATLARMTEAIKDINLDKVDAVGFAAKKKLSTKLSVIKEMQRLLKVEETASKRITRRKDFTDAEKIVELNKQIVRNIGKLQDRLNSLLEGRGDIGGKTPKDDFFSGKRTPPETVELKRQEANVKRDVMEALYRDRLKNETKPERFRRLFLDVINLPRSLMTAYDMSGVFRQGGPIVIANPKLLHGMIKVYIKAMSSKEGQFAVEHAIREMEFSKDGTFELAKIEFQEINPTSLTKQPEFFQSRLAESFPGLVATQQGFVTGLNWLRAQGADFMIRKLGKQRSVQELQTIGGYVNTATGLGEAGFIGKKLVALNGFLFAPRQVASRFKLILGEPIFRAYFTGSPRAAKIITTEYAKFLAMAATVYGLWQILPDQTVEPNALSSDFGKLKKGDLRVDILFGMGQNISFLARQIKGEKISLGSGKTIDLDNPLFGQPDRWDVASDFLRQKIAPVPGAIINTLVGTDPINQRAFWEGQAASISVPITFKDIFEGMVDQGIPKGTALSVLAVLGMGIASFDASRRMDKSTPEFNERMRRRLTLLRKNLNQMLERSGFETSFKGVNFNQIKDFEDTSLSVDKSIDNLIRSGN